MNSDMSELTVVEVNAHVARSYELTDDELRSLWAGEAARLGRCTVSGIERSEPFELLASLESSKEKRYRLTLEVESEAPHRIVTFDWDRQYDFNVVVREARARTGPRLQRLSCGPPS